VEHSPNVTTVRGVDTLLNCRVHKLDNMTVSWIKHGGVHLLAVGRSARTVTLDIGRAAGQIGQSYNTSRTIPNPLVEAALLYILPTLSYSLVEPASHYPLSPTL
jgi:hypothetical protein